MAGMRRNLGWVLGIVMLAGCGYAGYLRDPWTDIPAFGEVDNGIYRGAYPKAEGYRRLKSLGVKTLINLSDDKKYVERESELALREGFEFVHIPLSVYTWPEDKMVLLFLETLLDPDKRPVFVHCSNGRDRTGAMIAVYRTVVQGTGPKEAYREALSYGFWPYRGEVVLKRYIHQLKDRQALYDFVRSRISDEAQARLEAEGS